MLVDNIPKPGEQTFCHHVMDIPGGCTLNTAVHLAMMGEEVLLGGNDIGKDLFGEKLLDHLKKIHLKSTIQKKNPYGTPRCDVILDGKSRERSFVLHHKGIQTFRPEMVEKIDLSDIEIAFIDPYLKQASSAMLELIQNRCRKIWLQDISPDDPRVGLGDIVQISLKESTSVDQVKQIASQYFRGRCQAVFVTAGKQGAYLMRANKFFLHEPTSPIKVVDTTGCGDAFRAGALSVWRRNGSWKEMLVAGGMRGAYQASIWGSNPIIERGRTTNAPDKLVRL